MESFDGFTFADVRCRINQRWITEIRKRNNLYRRETPTDKRMGNFLKGQKNGSGNAISLPYHLFYLSLSLSLFSPVFLILFLLDSFQFPLPFYEITTISQCFPAAVIYGHKLWNFYLTVNCGICSFDIINYEICLFTNSRSFISFWIFSELFFSFPILNTLYLHLQARNTTRSNEISEISFRLLSIYSQWTFLSFSNRLLGRRRGWNNSTKRSLPPPSPRS